MRIYTYLEPITGLDLENNVKLLLIWMEHWQGLGYEPYVLQSWHAEQHPMFAEYDAAISKLPTINNPEYERACFHRWLAMAHVGGGIMADFDVFSVGGDLHPWSHQTGAEYASLTIWQDHNPCPCLVTGSQAEYERIANLFMGYRPEATDVVDDKPHVSDQNILQKHHVDFCRRDVVKHYRQEGWLQANALHLSNGNMVTLEKTPRFAHVASILKEHADAQPK